MFQTRRTTKSAQLNHEPNCLDLKLTDFPCMWEATWSLSFIVAINNVQNVHYYKLKSDQNLTD
ncbi:hypothetical protein HanXRQr2_Chr16g0766741 [Helianthus annuus]|uniref:Uncharacterized protein n=1 Tax=Helianthus annuus TaxID=4232 RepID=A0A9K3H043_HELAN|nr:hypothetical protein HanXRQr2_Chr16g0766741 [Helianthus annuus]KAJ0822677.1 hypothetical protein HanPSC8_Chr16g0734901 [Helianthus annuus]